MFVYPLSNFGLIYNPNFSKAYQIPNPYMIENNNSNSIMSAQCITHDLNIINCSRHDNSQAMNRGHNSSSIILKPFLSTLLNINHNNNKNDYNNIKSLRLNIVL